MSNSIFQNTGVNTPPRSVFDLSYTKKFTTDFGALYPIACDEMVPGDSFDIAVKINVKTQPLLAPVMHEINIYTHWFFVPYRLLWSGWTDFIFGGKSGDSNINSDGSFKKLLPRMCFKYTPSYDNFKKSVLCSPSAHRFYYPDQVGDHSKLWDAFGFPTINFFPGDTDVNDPFIDEPFSYSNSSNNDLSAPLLFPWLAYHFVYFNYYVDENLSTEYDPNTFNIEEYFHDKYNYIWEGVPHFEFKSGFTSFNSLRFRCFEKDYFTSCLPWQQRGTSPALPISFDMSSLMIGLSDKNTGLFTPNSQIQVSVDNTGQLTSFYTAPNLPQVQPYSYMTLPDLSRVSSSFDISDLRLAVQVQRFKELSARVGARYNEQIKGHFNVNMGDDRLQRPEYIGGSKQSLSIGEVYQTAESESPLASYAGTAQSNDISDIGSYYAPEHGLILGLMSIMPRPNYNQGINRQWLRRNMYDFYSPEFSHLSEQGVEQGEIYSDGSYANDSKIFGFQGRYNEMRCKQNLVCGDMRDSFNFWHLNRQFRSAPLLNTTFMQCNPYRNDFHRIFAVQDIDPFIVQCANIIRAVRPLPEMAIPGLLDHV